MLAEKSYQSLYVRKNKIKFLLNYMIKLKYATIPNSQKFCFIQNHHYFEIQGFNVHIFICWKPRIVTIFYAKVV